MSFSLCWPSLQTFSLLCFEKSVLQKVSLFYFYPNALIFIQSGPSHRFPYSVLFEWDFQGSSSHTPTAGVSLVIITRRWCGITEFPHIYMGQLMGRPHLMSFSPLNEF